MANQPSAFSKALALFQKNTVAVTPEGDLLPGLSVMDLSGPEQAAILEARKKKHDTTNTPNADMGSGEPGSSSEGG